ncbi:MAG TPA: hypothetical protein PK601_06810 [Methanothermobacter sp.]|nr:hypothetical protein [Methanothermobacter sp.]HOK72807.1 hypothetical protein [Methanothermobacter sp.]HPQ04756.1 hypothetical protein [Methanothermobacter sp.]HPU37681.1 hypothetical protein [Methanothermobacter sp.]
MDRLPKTFKDIVDRQKDLKVLSFFLVYINKRMGELQAEIKEEKSMIPVKVRKRLGIKENMKIDGLTITKEKVNCGKPNCKRCPHGPYYYAYKQVNGKLKRLYIGRKLPEALKPYYREKG